MLNTLTRVFLAFLFLTSSIILPMGDFYLMQDLPSMYQNYTHLTTAEDAGVIDFIGDYLLGGKEIFDHNKRDKVDPSAGGVNFQHQANPLPVLFTTTLVLLTPVKELRYKLSIPDIKSILPAFSSTVFRPPIG